MSRSLTNDTTGILGLTLTQIGLMIATAIILLAVFSAIFLSDWQRSAELESIASSFSTAVQGMDARYLENTTVFRFPHKDYPYTVTISSEYIVVSAKGHWNNELSAKERFIVRPWPQNSTLSPDWVGGKELHQNLSQKYGTAGNVSDPIQNTVSWQELLDRLSQSRNTTIKTLVSTPLVIQTNKSVYIDKTMLYFSEPDEYSECKLGKDFDWSASSTGLYDVHIVDDNVSITSFVILLPPFIVYQAVEYVFPIPYQSNNVASIDVHIKYLANFEFLSDKDPGPQLSLYNWNGGIIWHFPWPWWFESTYLHVLKDHLGYSRDLTWYNTSVTDVGIFSDVLNQTTGKLIVDLRTVPTSISDLFSNVLINQVCITAKPIVKTTDQKQSFVLVYQ